MLRILKQALISGPVTNSYPGVIAEPPDGFRGRPAIDFERCTACGKCAEACPTAAITVRADEKNAGGKIVSINYGDCIFCGECETACPTAIHLTKEFELAATGKANLITSARYAPGRGDELTYAGLLSRIPLSTSSFEDIGQKLKEKTTRVFGRSLHIREVDAGSCNGCEVEITALNNPVYDIERFGVHFVASPRFADMLLVTGPVTRNMEIALRQTYEATPDPKLVVAVGACAIGGGVFGKSYASCGGVDNVVPVDVYIPGSPPRPEALLHGILMAIEKYPVRNHA
jgi:Ni,Fe-hydrogenase III small subunit/formate hydrogenlyase subunit 6/NADH:ubiquinone oxidoreductase subunit I